MGSGLSIYVGGGKGSKTNRGFTIQDKENQVVQGYLNMGHIQTRAKANLRTDNKENTNTDDTPDTSFT